MSCNYPAGMSRADLIHVGAIAIDEAPAWFEELISDEYATDLQDLWDEFTGYEEVIDGPYTVEEAASWFNEYHPEAMNEDCREVAA